MRPAWSYADLTGDLRTDHEERVAVLMLDEFGEPKPRFASWTPAEALAHIRNIAAERVRATAHGTGCE